MASGLRHAHFVVDEKYRHYVDGVADYIRDQGVVSSFASIEEFTTAGNLPGVGLVATIHSISKELGIALEGLKGRIPTLMLQDGVIEHQHCWEKPAALGRYRPVLCEYMAVFGERSKSIITAWQGLADERLIVTGSPRFDVYANEMPIDRAGRPLLVTCANTPYVDTNSRRLFLAFMESVVTELVRSGLPFFLRLPGKNEGLLRKSLTKVFDQLDPGVLRDPSAPLVQDLRECGAILTTPSTVALEAMMLGIPTGLMQPGWSPVYLSSAWVVSSPDMVRDVAADMLAPPREKLTYQNLVCCENVVADGKATRRVGDVILRLMEAGRL